jgi:NFU1 iron-sulfur cluster scaffold homolog, mitochondrial
VKTALKMTTATQPILVYTEATPNPATLKFVTNRILLTQGHLDMPNPESAAASPLAQELFGFPFVKGVFLAANFVTLTKDAEAVWQEIIPTMREYLKDYLAEGKTVVDEAWLKEQQATHGEAPLDANDTESKIKAVLEKYVRPAVEMDGGAIIFKSFEDGVVNLQLQGACSGCPSSMVTLKQGIEGLLKRMVPEVQMVEAEEG